MSTKRLSVYTVQLVRESSMRYEVPQGQIRNDFNAAEIIGQYLRNVDREHFVVLLLNHKYQITGIHTAHIGTLTGAAVSAREVFKVAILSNAAAIMVGHNHPSGNPVPSPRDIALTHRLSWAGQILDIPLLDHIIVAFDLGGTLSHYSLKNNGELEAPKEDTPCIS